MLVVLSSLALVGAMISPSPEDCWAGDGPRDYCLGVDYANSLRLGAYDEKVDADVACDPTDLGTSMTALVLDDGGAFRDGCRDALASY